MNNKFSSSFEDILSVTDDEYFILHGEFRWEQGFSYLKTFVEQIGHAIVPYSYKTEDEFKLGGWVSRQRRKKEQLTPEQITKLESLDGWIWDATNNQITTSNPSKTG